ncbi:MAG TPA: hypothetical protein VFY18_04325 [Candidatus Limnocylindrales bacterium]|nr:hypothetical protein [Candidatus Limnocylindrales bacterium]
MKIAGGLLFAAAAIFLVVLVVRPWSPKPYHGEGTVSSYLWCMAFAPAGGGVIPISAWPDGLVAQGYDGVLVDATGQVVLRTGDHITFDGTLSESDGDTPCTNTRVIKVERFERKPAPSD